MPPATATATVRAIPLWLLRAYLEELGGQVQPDGSVAGAGWQARLSQLEDDAVGALRIGRVRLDWEGEAGVVAALRAALAPKLLRAGG